MDNDTSDNDEKCEINLTGFLFGNIDSTGRLEDDIFDNDTKQQLRALARLIQKEIHKNKYSVLIVQN